MQQCLLAYGSCSTAKACLDALNKASDENGYLYTAVYTAACAATLVSTIVLILARLVLPPRVIVSHRISEVRVCKTLSNS